MRKIKKISFQSIDSLGDRIILCMTILFSIGYIDIILQKVIVSGKLSIQYFVEYGLSILIAWSLYLLYHAKIIKTLLNKHETPFSILFLTAFIAFYNPMLFDEIWVIFLFYPIVISLLQDKKVYIKWNIYSFIIYNLFLLFHSNHLFDNSLSLLSFISKIYLGLGSVGIGWIILNYRLNVKEKTEREIEEKNIEYIIQVLHSLIPIVERKSQTSSKEIEQMSMLMRKTLLYLPDEIMEEWEIRMVSLLHYVSKIKVPDYVFEKTDKLTRYEFEMVQEHACVAKDLLKNYPSFQNVQAILKHHHERVDGLGYPQQLDGINIPIKSQVLGIVESFLAMTTPRSYRDALSFKEAIKEIEDTSEKAYNKEVVKALKYALSVKSEEFKIYTLKEQLAK